MTSLTSAVVSITATQRRRFFWAAWWTHAPQASPFRRPDASNGGAATYEEALADAQRAAGRHLTAVDPWWARAWKSVLRGDPVPPPPRERPPRAKPSAEAPTQPASAWAVLGLEPGASRDAVLRAFRRRALETHPDRGGDPDDFLAVRRAYERLLERTR